MYFKITNCLGPKGGKLIYRSLIFKRMKDNELKKIQELDFSLPVIPECHRYFLKISEKVKMDP